MSRTLGAAWDEARAALPKGWTLEVTQYPPEYADQLGLAHAEAWNTNGGVSKGHVREDGPTPAVALRALAAALRGWAHDTSALRTGVSADSGSPGTAP